MADANNNSNEIAHDFSPLLRVFKDGRVERYSGLDIVHASVDPDTGVQSKDIEIVPDLKLTLRIYLPKKTSPGHKHPILIYFHGGGFVLQSAFCDLYHRYINLIVAETNAIVLSVNYRKAPENPLPAAYEDSWLALKWVASHSSGGDVTNHEIWLKEYADFDRIYLGGDSAGGNLAHNLAMRASLEKLEGINNNNISGIFLSCPFFWGKEPIGNEAGEFDPEIYLNRDFLNRIWFFAYPGTSGLDDPLLNPAMNPDISRLCCKKILVFVAGRDILKYRGWWYRDVLLKSGWVGDVEVLEIEGEVHTFDLFDSENDNAIFMKKKLALLINSS